MYEREIIINHLLETLDEYQLADYVYMLMTHNDKAEYLHEMRKEADAEREMNAIA